MTLPSSSPSSFSPPRTPSHRPHRLSLPLNSPFEPFPSSFTPSHSYHATRLVDDSPLDPPSISRSPLGPQTQLAHIAPRSSVNLLDVLSLDASPVRTQRVGSSSSDQVSPNVVAMATPSTPPTGPRGDTDIELLRPLSAFNPSPQRTSSFTSTSPGLSPGSPAHSPSTSSQSHANSPPLDTSFMRWSKTTSTIFSEAPSSHFYFNKRSTGTFSDFAPSPEKPPRLPTANLTSSNSNSNPSSLPSNAGKGGHAKEESDETVGTASSSNHHNPDGKRESAGTFGSRQRRWSEANSGGHGVGGQDESTPRLGQSFWDDAEEGNSKSPSTGLRRRPRSMSSASDSTPSASVFGAEVSSAQLHRANSQAGSGSGYFPSPTQRKVSHKRPESERKITAHLIKTSARNDLRIVPRSRPPPLGLSLSGGITSPAPPSSGTPLKAGGVTEESIHGDSGESDLGLGGGTSLVRVGSKRKTGKLDQMLGEGAETARVLMEFERRAIESAVQTSQGQQPPTRPLPPPRGHKPSVSMPSMTVPSTPTTPPCVYDHPEHLATYSPTHGRSGSLDSVSSLHPSLSDSVTTLSRLFPSSCPVPPVPSRPRPTHRTPLAPLPPLPPLPARNDLLPEQRAVLIRRARKIEQVLGEPLPESQVERLVVDPSHASTTVVTSVNHEWPETPSPRGKVPEWDQEDCVPRTVRREPKGMAMSMSMSTSNPNPGSGVLGGGNLVRSGSIFAKKAKAALRRDKKDDESSDLKVYVAREMRVVETTVRGGSSVEAARPRINRQEWIDPASPTGLLTPGSPTDTLDQRSEEEDGARRARRQQLAKLHRLLGVPIPASLVTQGASSDDLPFHSISGQAAVGARRSDSPSDLSFMMFDEPSTAASSWASRLRSTVTPKSSKDKEKERKGKLSSSPPPASSSMSLLSKRKSSKDMDVTRDESSRDRLNSLVSESELGAAVGMSDKEKAVARRKAAKLEQVFGDPPPQAMYLPSHRPSMSVNLSRDMPATSFPTPPTHLPPSNDTGNGRNGSANAKGEYQTYHASLQNLLHLVETDRARLTSIVDSLEPSNSSQHGTGTAGGQSGIAFPGVTGGAGGTIRARGQVLNDGAGHGYTSSVESRMTADRGSSSPPSPALRSPSFPARQQSPQISNHDHVQCDSDHNDDDYSERQHKATANVDDDVDVDIGFDPNSRAARRKRTGNLTSFFGESSINFADPHPPPAPGFGFSAYPNDPDHSVAGATGNGHGHRSGSGSRGRKGTGNEYGIGLGIGNGNGNGHGGIRRKRMTRIETLDNVLGEMWRGVQAEMRKGGLGLEEGRKLGEMMGTLRRRSGGVWEEI